MSAPGRMAPAAAAPQAAAPAGARPLVVGLTGRSGCGKSTVAALYRQAGWPVLDADRTAAEVYRLRPACLQQLAQAFGADILDEAGALRRRVLAARAFADAASQQRLTQITHPHIVRLLLDTIEQAAAAGARMVFVDGAVIVGAPFQAHCQRLVVVDAPQRLLVPRLCARDGIPPAAARRRLAVQPSRRQLLRAADAVIVNDGDQAELRRRALQVLQRLEEEL